MWNNLPFDLLAQVLSHLSPHTLAQAASVCKQWRECTKTQLLTTTTTTTLPIHHPPWFFAMTARTRVHISYAYDPTLIRWHALPLNFLPSLVSQPFAAVSTGLLLCKPATAAAHLRLALCNPLTRRYKLLPPLNTPRSNPAVGVVSEGTQFQIYVVGGMSKAAGGGADYEPSMEMYDSEADRWRNLGDVPVAFAVRLTVWTQSESVYCDGVLYWITSARAFSVMALGIGSRACKEVRVPMEERLQCAALVRRKGRLALVGGVREGGACVWELGEGGAWGLVERVPIEMGEMFVGRRGGWCNTKCVGGDGVLYLFRDCGSDMLVWKEQQGRCEWGWVKGCGYREQGIPIDSPIKGVILNPSLACSYLLD